MGGTLVGALVGPLVGTLVEPLVRTLVGPLMGSHFCSSLALCLSELSTPIFNFLSCQELQD